MALTTQQQGAIRAIIATGGLDVTINDIRALAITDKKAAGTAALQSAVSVTIADWPAVTTAIAQASAFVLPTVVADLNTAVVAHDPTKLGPLLVQLLGAVKALYGI